MFKRTLIATAAAGMLAAGSLVAGSAPAAASGYVSGSIHFGGPGFSLHFGAPGYYHHHHHRHHCKPIVKKVKYWHKGKARWKNVVVGQNCHHRRPPPKVVYPYHPWGPYW
jgi:hypothetical protein